MGWLSKVFGIDSRRRREKEANERADKAAALAEQARKEAAEQAKLTNEQTQQYNQSMLEIQKNSLATAQNAQAAEERRINDARDAALKREAEDAQREQNADVLAANNRVDLRADTVANVIAGGTAEVAAVEEVKRKRQAPTNTLATQLGINI